MRHRARRGLWRWLLEREPMRFDEPQQSLLLHTSLVRRRLRHAVTHVPGFEVSVQQRSSKMRPELWPYPAKPIAKCNSESALSTLIFALPKIFVGKFDAFPNGVLSGWGIPSKTQKKKSVLVRSRSTRSHWQRRAQRSQSRTRRKWATAACQRCWRC